LLNQTTGQVEKLRVGNEIKVINVKNKVGIPFVKMNTNFDFPVPGQKGGWNKGKDIIDILKKRGRIAQRATKFQYNGLDIEEWSNIGSKRSSEAMFCADKALMEDAEKLIYSLMEKSHTTLLESVTREDIDEVDIAGQDDPKSINIEELVTPNPEADEIDEPVSEQTL